MLKGNNSRSQRRRNFSERWADQGQCLARNTTNSVEFEAGLNYRCGRGSGFQNQHRFRQYDVQFNNTSSSYSLEDLKNQAKIIENHLNNIKESIQKLEAQQQG